MPAEQHAAHARDDRESDGHGDDCDRGRDPLLHEEVRARREHGGRVGGVAAGVRGLGLAAREGDGRARSPVDELDGVMGEDGSDRRRRERGQHGKERRTPRDEDECRARRPDGGMHVRLAGQGADVRGAQDVPQRTRSAGTDLECVVDRLDGGVEGRQREADGGREAGGGDGGE